MKIVVDALSPKIGGTLSYVTQQMAAMERVRPDFEFVVLTAPWNTQAFKRALQSDVTEIPVPNVPLRVLYEQTLMLARSRAADLLYCPTNFCPVIRSGPPRVVTMHNPNYFGPPRHLAENRRLRRRIEIGLSRYSLVFADATVVVSRSMLSQIESDGHPTHRCRVVYSAAPDWPEESVPPMPLHSGYPFILSLANDYPHKRLEDVVLAWSLAFHRRERPPLLVLVGGVSPKRQRQLLNVIPARLHGAVLMLGKLGDRRCVRWLVENAKVMVSASQLEAFPLTPLEAGSLGCPLILSDIPPHREVAQENARYFPLGNTECLAEELSFVFDSIDRHHWTWPVTWYENARQVARIFEEVAART
jgi:glycosyltransferase involved in cell wall biosynthesis